MENLVIGEEPTVREMTRLELIWARVRAWLIWRRRNNIPYLVWWGDELDVTVTFSEDKLTSESMDGAMCQFKGGAFHEVEIAFANMGITFDTGMGGCGRDWEWDWSLDGPVSIQFRGCAKRPERRKARPRPRLVHDSKGAA